MSRTTTPFQLQQAPLASAVFREAQTREDVTRRGRICCCSTFVFICLNFRLYMNMTRIRIYMIMMDGCNVFRWPGCVPRHVHAPCVEENWILEPEAFRHHATSAQPKQHLGIFIVCAFYFLLTV